MRLRLAFSCQHGEQFVCDHLNSEWLEPAFHRLAISLHYIIQCHILHMCWLVKHEITEGVDGSALCISYLRVLATEFCQFCQFCVSKLLSCTFRLEGFLLILTSLNPANSPAISGVNILLQ